jgi:hypothetical protein
MRKEERLVPKNTSVSKQAHHVVFSTFHEPSQDLPFSPREHLQLRQERSSAPRLREPPERASAFGAVRGGVGDRTSLLSQTRAVSLCGWGMCEVEQMVRDVVPGCTGRAALRKVLGRREASGPFV